jgi:hypothetical protein
MKVIFILILFTGMYHCAKAQVFQQDYQTHGDYLDVYDEKGNKVKVSDHPLLAGNSTLNKEWATGSVVLNNGMQATNMQLQFDIKQNALYFKNDGHIYAFAGIVRACIMTYEENGEQNTVLLRSGYPDANGDSTNVLYQVITEGPNIQFLKLLKPTVDEQYTYGYAEKQSYGIKEESYIYLVDKKQLVKIKENEKSVENALSDYANQVQKFIADKNVKLDSDAQIAELIDTLNSVN